MDKLLTNRKYDCYCGTGVALEFAASYILEHTTVKDITALKIAVVSDRVVSGYYYNRFENQFILRGVKPVLVPVEAVNASKSLSAAEDIFKYLTDFDFGPSDWLIALGGGGILDVTGFVAGVFDGGINFMAVPTTLNSMCVGAVADYARLNVTSHKDEISVPFEPDVVICDPEFLKTVPDKIKSNGYAAVIRYAILDDLSLILELEEQKNLREFLNRVYASRAKIVRTDPRLLTLGDELSSAIEGYFRFMNYSEGEALALSLLSAVDEKRRKPLSQIYGLLKLPTVLKDVSTKMILKTLCDRLDRRTTDRIEIVDMETSDKARWVVRNVSYIEAKDLFEERLAVIGRTENI